MRKYIGFFFLSLFFSLLHLNSQAQRPNIIMILIDDANKNNLPPNAPSFMKVPNIKRIYKEGALFNNVYCVFSYCNPSRSSLLTGVYPHVHGAVSNSNKITNTSLPLFTSILQNAGYHNLVIGKYTNLDVNPLYFEKKMCINKIKYSNATYYVNEVKKQILGNTTKIIGDTMCNWIAKVDTPFFAWVGHIAPHGPVGLPVQDKDVYKNKNIKLPANADFFPDDYPSFLYKGQSNYTSDSLIIRMLLEKQYEVMLEVDRGLGRLFDTLTKRGILDNTFIVFTNDNGAFTGEHYLLGKQKPYEAAESLPMFIRYPAWFPKNTTTVNSQLLLSIDLTSTFLTVAGIDPEPYNFQGISLDKQLFSNPIKRECVYFEKIKSAYEGDPDDVGDTEAPSWRAVRTLSYKYVRYRCDSLVEELFDMKNDSLENTNVARNSAYASALDSMRLMLDSMAVATHDTLSIDTIIGKCHLVDLINNPRLSSVLPFEVIAYPQPASEVVRISMVSGKSTRENIPMQMELLNQLGIRVQVWDFLPANGLSMNIDVSHLSRGLYFLRTTRESRTA